MLIGVVALSLSKISIFDRFSSSTSLPSKPSSDQGSVSPFFEAVVLMVTNGLKKYLCKTYPFFK